MPSFVFGQTARSQVAPTNPGSHSHANVALVHTPCPEHLETQRRLLQAFPKNPARHLHSPRMHRPAPSHSPRWVYGHTRRSHAWPAKPGLQKHFPVDLPEAGSVVTLQIPWLVHLFGHPRPSQVAPTNPGRQTQTAEVAVTVQNPPLLQGGSHAAC